MATQPSATELKMDPSSLYREEMFTDRKMGAIRVLTPVKSDGAPDGTFLLKDLFGPRLLRH